MVFLLPDTWGLGSTQFCLDSMIEASKEVTVVAFSTWDMKQMLWERSQITKLSCLVLVFLWEKYAFLSEDSGQCRAMWEPDWLTDRQRWCRWGGGGWISMLTACHATNLSHRLWKSGSASFRQTCRHRRPGTWAFISLGPDGTAAVESWHLHWWGMGRRAREEKVKGGRSVCGRLRKKEHREERSLR